MSTSSRTEEGSAAATQAAIANSLEQVREILFGAQHRDFARRLARIDAHVAAQAEEMRSEARRRLEALEQHINKESEALTSMLEAQRSAHLEALNNASREAREAIGLLEQRVQKLEELTARAQRDFRQQLLDQTKTFIDEARRMRGEISAAMERELAAHGEDEAAEPSREDLWKRPSEAA
jgi:hypothetical protein